MPQSDAACLELDLKLKVTGIFVDNAKALKGADEDAMYLEVRAVAHNAPR